MTMAANTQNGLFHVCRSLAVIMVAVALNGCFESQPSDLWQDYSMRLHNGLALVRTSIPANNQPLAWPPLPSRKDRLVELTSPSMNLWEFLKVYDCELTIHVAKQNGPLGKVMLPSQRFIYGMQWIPLAERCLNTAQLNDKARVAIQRGLDFYRTNQIALFQNGIFHQEFETAFKPSAVWSMEQTYPAIGEPTLEDLSQIILAKDTLHTLSSEWLESRLKSLSERRLPGNWLLHVTQATHELQALNQAMAKQTRLCPMGSPTPQSRIALNVFHRYFAADIQPWVSQLHRFGQSLKEQLTRLSQQNQAMETYTHALFDAKDGPWVQFTEQWQAHVQAWQDQLRQCNLMPSGPMSPEP